MVFAAISSSSNIAHWISHLTFSIDIVFIVLMQAFRHVLFAATYLFAVSVTNLQSPVKRFSSTVKESNTRYSRPAEPYCLYRQP